MKKIKGYKYRIYPNRAQCEKLAMTFGCVRFVYNKCLEEQERRFLAGENFASRFEMNNYCTHVLKAEFPFLKDVDKFALNNTIFNLDSAYRQMFNDNSAHPKYKSKHRSKASYTTNFTNNNIKVFCNAVQLPKLGRVKAVIHRMAPEEYVLKSATITMERDGTYYISINYAYEINPPLAAGNDAVGLDYKSDGLYVSSDGEICNMPHYYRESQPKLAKEQRKLRNKKPGSKNWEKQQKKIAKTYRHIANQRKDFLHKRSTEIANQYYIVCVEDLNLQTMSNKGFGNGKANMDNGYGMFLNMLDYKLTDRGKQLIKVDKWYPSSQICSCCGSRQAMPLTARKYECPRCGAVLDRDLNAAINILNEGLIQIS